MSSLPGAQVIKESGALAGNEPRPFFDFLEGCLRHKVWTDQLASRLLLG